jgi:hypothetical protein
VGTTEMWWVLGWRLQSRVLEIREGIIMKHIIKTVLHSLKWMLFSVLDTFAQRGSKTAHQLACKFLPY